MKFVRSVCLLLFLFSASMPGVSILNSAFAENPSHLISNDTIIDSRMSEKEAFDGLDPKCPEDILKKQKIVNLRYYSYDKKIHEGQIVIDGELENDIRAVFEVALKEHFPIYSVIPISDKRFFKDGCWSDDLSMDANNTSAFNFRLKTGGSELSKHAYGRAIDINPFQNPYIKKTIVLPQGSKYDPGAEGTLTSDHPIVRAFLKLGWEWGGNWTTLKDYQHFEK